MSGNETGLGERAIEHICFLADVNQLYESALGLYDLTLALAVVQKSQKDPREYMPYLQNLQKMELRRRQFTIDDGLHRYVKALKHLHAMAQFEEFAKYAEKHALYEEALSLYSYESDKVNHLTMLYAASLNSKNRHKEAGLGELACLMLLSLNYTNLYSIRLSPRLLCCFYGIQIGPLVAGMSLLCISYTSFGR